jgi:hypothetical protein
MSRFTLLHTFTAPRPLLSQPAAPPGPVWPPHVPEARVSPPDEEPTGEELREALRANLLNRSAQLRERILASQDPELRRALEAFECAWEEYQDEGL